jgi:putative hydrolase of the HAD superfamily
MTSWVVFDAVGTLLTPSPSVAGAYHQVGRSLGSRLDVAEVGKRFREFFAHSETACFLPERQGRTSEPEERDRWRWIVARVLDDVDDQPACFERLWDHFADPAVWRMYDDVPEIISRLTAANIRLAVASNFDARLHPLCAAFPPLRQLAVRLVSSEVGYRKPAVGFYEAVIVACGVPAESILMVGDDWLGDVVAARQAGMQAVWLDRRGTGAHPHGITSLRDLAAASR